MPATKDSVAQFNGGIPLAVTSASMFTRLVSIPFNVVADACQLSLLNTHGTATMFFKWVNSGSNATFPTADAGIFLAPGAGYVVEVVKPEMDLIGTSTVVGAVCAVDFVAKLKA